MEVYCANPLFVPFIPAYLFAIAQTEIDSSVFYTEFLTPLNTLVIALCFGFTI
jgi:hypothetical protein